MNETEEIREVFLVDIDGTISEDVPNEEEHRMPDAFEITGAKDYWNALYDEGHLIVFFTARLEKHRLVTEEWLRNFGFKYHSIVFGKPRIYGFSNYHWVDNAPIKATRFLGTYPNSKDKTLNLKPEDAFLEVILENTQQ